MLFVSRRQVNVLLIEVISERLIQLQICMISIVKLDLRLCYRMEYEIYSEIRVKVLLPMEHGIHSEVGGNVMLLNEIWLQ